MKKRLVLLFLVLGMFVYGQSAKKLNKELRAEWASEQQKQDSAFLIFEKSYKQVLQYKNQADKKSEQLSEQARLVRGTQGKIRLVLADLNQLLLYPKMGDGAKYMDLPGARDVIRPIKNMGKGIESFGKVSTEINLDGLKRKQQNELLRTKIEEFHESERVNSLRLLRNEGKKEQLELALLQLDSMLTVYQDAQKALVLEQKALDKQREAARENYRLKGPKGFSEAYGFLFPDVHPVTNRGDSDVPIVGEKVVENPQPEIYEFIDEFPEFPGGIPALMKYLSDNINYPQSAMENGIQGKVVLRFVVSASGEVSRVIVMKELSGCKECGLEAVRVVKKMPKWKPGKANGKVVDCYFNLPVSFSLD